MRFRRTLAALAVVISFMPETYGMAADQSSAGVWHVTHVTDPASGKFNYCAVESGFDNGLWLAFARNRDFNTNIVVSFPEKRLDQKSKYRMMVGVDNYPMRDLVGFSADPTILVIPIQHDRKMLDWLEHGKILELKGPQDSVKFSLDGAAGALQQLELCVEKSLKEETSGKGKQAPSTQPPAGTMAQAVPPAAAASLPAAPPGSDIVEPLPLPSQPSEVPPVSAATRPAASPPSAPEPAPSTPTTPAIVETVPAAPRPPVQSAELQPSVAAKTESAVAPEVMAQSDDAYEKSMQRLQAKLQSEPPAQPQPPVVTAEPAAPQPQPAAAPTPPSNPQPQPTNVPPLPATQPPVRVARLPDTVADLNKLYIPQGQAQPAPQEIKPVASAMQPQAAIAAPNTPVRQQAQSHAQPMFSAAATPLQQAQSAAPAPPPVLAAATTPSGEMASDSTTDLNRLGMLQVQPQPQTIPVANVAPAVQDKAQPPVTPVMIASDQTAQPVTGSAIAARPAPVTPAATISLTSLLATAGIHSAAQDDRRTAARTFSWNEGGINGVASESKAGRPFLDTMLNDIDVQEKRCKGRFSSAVGAPIEKNGVSFAEVTTACGTGSSGMSNVSLYYQSGGTFAAITQQSGTPSQDRALQTRARLEASLTAGIP